MSLRLLLVCCLQLLIILIRRRNIVYGSTHNNVAETKGKYSELEMEFDIIYPRISYSTLRNKRLSDHQSIQHRLSNSSLHVNFRAFKRNFDMSLVPNEKLIATGLQVEFLGKKGKRSIERINGECFYSGTLESSKRSAVSMSDCNGLVGVIDNGMERFVIHPAPSDSQKKHDRLQRSTNAHILRRMRKDDDYDINSEDDLGKRHRIKDISHHYCGTSSASLGRWKRGAISGKQGQQTIEALIVVDQKLAQYYGVDASKQYALTIANIAHGILRDASIGPNPVNLVVTKIQILTAPQDNLHISHHAERTLSSFGKWVTNAIHMGGADQPRYDYGILLTRYDICKSKEEPCDTLGLSYTGGLCKFPTSVALVEDNGLMAGYTLAHQIGHSLGMNHDGVGNSCSDQNAIMNPSGGIAGGSYQWSDCSVDYLQQFLSTDRSKCLEDHPPENIEDIINLYRNPGEIFDAADQCRFIAGQHARLCHYDDLDEICTELVCLVPSEGKCTRTGRPPVDGTQCGRYKWCKESKCVNKVSPGDYVVDGQWSSWGDYSQCSRSCGGGIRRRERKCQSPKPKHGGKFCEGSARSYSLCSLNPCEDETKTFRDTQCQQHDGELYFDKKSNWTTADNQDPTCALQCKPSRDTSSIINFGDAEDGTECIDTSTNVQGRCIAGKCESVGCNMVLGSQEKLDRCGVCGGDGNSCNKMPGGQSIQGDNRHNILQLKKDSNDSERIQSLLGKLMHLRKVMKGVVREKCSGNAGCLSKFQYYNLKQKKTEISKPEQFDWDMISTGCSVSCDAGTETLFPECRRLDDGSPVSAKYCDSNMKPPSITKECRRSPCAPRWMSSEWSDCTKSCNNGTRKRRNYCVQPIDGEDYFLLQSQCDRKTQPKVIQSCNMEPCPPEWFVEPFGPCSTSCGKGTQVRTVLCKKQLPSGNNVVLNDNKCNPRKKPQTELICNVHNPCPGQGGCGGRFVEQDGLITSPNFPENYPSNKECVSEITVPPGLSIELSFLQLKIASPSPDTCGADFLRISDGPCSGGSLNPTTVYCGSTIPSAFVSTKNQLCLKFVSDSSGADKGFAVHYRTVPEPTEEHKIIDICDVNGQTITGLFGVLISPNYPTTYPINEDCSVKVKLPSGTGFVITFEDFRVGTRTGILGCDNDYLEISHEDIPEKICGTQNPGKVKIPGNEFSATFHSGPIQASGIGFVLTYMSKEFLKSQLSKVRAKIQDKGLGMQSVSGMMEAIHTPSEIFARFHKANNLTREEEERAMERSLVVSPLSTMKKSYIARYSPPAFPTSNYLHPYHWPTVSSGKRLRHKSLINFVHPTVVKSEMSPLEQATVTKKAVIPTKPMENNAGEKKADIKPNITVANETTTEKAKWANPLHPVFAQKPFRPLFQSMITANTMNDQDKSSQLSSQAPMTEKEFMRPINERLKYQKLLARWAAEAGQWRARFPSQYFNSFNGLSSAGNKETVNQERLNYNNLLENSVHWTSRLPHQYFSSLTGATPPQAQRLPQTPGSAVNFAVQPKLLNNLEALENERNLLLDQQTAPQASTAQNAPQVSAFQRTNESPVPQSGSEDQALYNQHSLYEYVYDNQGPGVQLSDSLNGVPEQPYPYLTSDTTGERFYINGNDQAWSNAQNTMAKYTGVRRATVRNFKNATIDLHSKNKASTASPAGIQARNSISNRQKLGRFAYQRTFPNSLKLRALTAKPVSILNPNLYKKPLVRLNAANKANRSQILQARRAWVPQNRYFQYPQKLSPFSNGGSQPTRLIMNKIRSYNGQNMLQINQNKPVAPFTPMPRQQWPAYRNFLPALPRKSATPLSAPWAMARQYTMTGRQNNWLMPQTNSRINYYRPNFNLNKLPWQPTATVTDAQKRGSLQTQTPLGDQLDYAPCPEIPATLCTTMLYGRMCRQDRDCLVDNKVCCPVSCHFAKRICIPKDIPGCPPATDGFKGKTKCVTGRECGTGKCCETLTTEKYCYP